MVEEDEEVSENIGLGCALDMFHEADEVKELIHQLSAESEKLAADPVGLERGGERWRTIFDLYQEQPHLLDPQLETFLSSLISLIRRKDSIPRVILYQAFKYLYLITKVRGYKTVVRLLPHEVSDLEPVLRMLHEADGSGLSNFETEYILLLWLSIIILLPFPMSRLEAPQLVDADDASSRPTPSMTTQDRVLKEIKSQLLYAIFDFRRTVAAGYLAAVFLSRPDTKEACLEEFVSWSLVQLRNSSTPMGCQLAITSALSRLFKHGKREDLLPSAKQILDVVLSLRVDEEDFLLRKVQLKLVQRVGLTFLRPRVAVWRYQRGCRSLADNLNLTDSGVPESRSQLVERKQDEEEYDVPEEIEVIIEQMLQGLRHTKTTVRWTSAKGIGRIASRLPEDLADDVIGSILELFSPNEMDSAWHGSCLALAELGRRGLLLPSRLSEIMRVLNIALFYDIPQGAFSVGSNVRDAACYVAWSFARAYDPKELESFVTDLARSLVVMCCFDREIHCRRAASAAFQENVGRQGSFPHGIEIVTTADFFAVSNRNQAYLEISHFIAQFPEYCQPLLDHLILRKVNHWDVTVRELTAKALRKLTPLDPEYVGTIILPKLMALASSTSDINAKHGSLLSLAEVACGIVIDVNRPELLEASMLEFLKGFVSRLRGTLVFRQLGADMMRSATCVFIERMSQANIGVEAAESWLEHLWECFVYLDAQVQGAACSALSALIVRTTTDLQKQILETLALKLMTSDKQARMGFSQAIGRLPSEFLSASVFLKPLIYACTIRSGEETWADARREGVRSLGTLTASLASRMSPEEFHEVFDLMFQSLADYTMEKRGDVGAWVREAAMSSLVVVVEAVIEADRQTEILNVQLMQRILGLMAQQACEKIFRTRTLAGTSFLSLLHSRLNAELIPQRTQLSELFPRDASANWEEGGTTTSIYGYFVELLMFPEYRKFVLIGLIQAMGGVTEHLIRRSSDAFFSISRRVLDTIGKGEGQRILQEWVNLVFEIWEDNQRNDRVVIPLVSTLDKILNANQFAFLFCVPEAEEGKRMLELVRIEMSKCGNVSKILAAVNLLCDLLSYEDSRIVRRAIQNICLYLCFRYPRVRKATAARLYEALLVGGDSLALGNSDPEALDKALSILSETFWEGDLEEAKKARSQFCDALSVPHPVVIRKPDAT